jgi:DNA-binding NtrC family response regulator
MPNAADVSVSLLIIDDDHDSLEQLSDELAQPGLEILVASDAKTGLDIACRCRPRIVLATPQPNGQETLERIAEMDYNAHAISLPTHYSGEREHRDKPIPLEELRARVARLAREVRRRRALRLDESRPEPDFEGIVGRSPLMRETFSRVRRIAPFYRAVLIMGKTGTGKRLVARALHRLSPVSKERYAILKCSAVDDTVFEGELFGDAATDRPGLFELADGGTVYLDEIEDMPLAIQAKFLRMLESQEVQRAGSLKSRKTNVRVIASTTRDLRTLVAEKRFREDLYHRLSMVEIRLPRLADRREDLPLLQRHFIARFAAEYGKEIPGFSHAAHILLSLHSWPGNVRELENVIGSAAMMTDGGMIDIADLPLYLQTDTAQRTDLYPSTCRNAETLYDHERQVMAGALEAAGGNQSKAASLLRIGSEALRYKLRKHKPGATEASLRVVSGN